MQGDVAETLRALGIPDEVIDRAVERGDAESAIFEAAILPAVEERTVTAEEIEAAGGLDVESNLASIEAFGFPVPAPDEPWFARHEADALIELGKLRDYWPGNLLVQVSRVYGRLLARIAQTEIQLFRLHAERTILADREDRLAALHELRDVFTRLVPLADPLITGVHRRWLEHELGQVAVAAAEEGAGQRALPGAAEVTFLFCDLKDFTVYADSEGDEAAVAVIDHFARIVSRERGQSFRFHKALGDGAMLVYKKAEDAVAAGARIVDAMREPETPGVHASTHCGTAIVREGDYFGAAVNLAARLLNAADRDELVATRAVLEECGGGGFQWEPAGTQRIKGIAEPVEVFRLGAPLSPRR